VTKLVRLPAIQRTNHSCGREYFRFPGSWTDSFKSGPLSQHQSITHVNATVAWQGKTKVRFSTIARAYIIRPWMRTGFARYTGVESL